MKSIYLSIIAGALCVGAMCAADREPLFTDNNFESFPDQGWTFSGVTADSAVSVCETESAEGVVVKSLFLKDEDLDAQVPPLAAKVMIGDLSQAAITNGITVGFDVKMENPEANNCLFFKVLGATTTNLNRFVGGIQLLNNWGGTEGGLKYGNAHAAIGNIAYDKWFHLEVKLPGENGPQTQNISIHDLADPSRVYSYSEETNTDARDYSALVFSSGLGDARKLRAYIRNISVVANTGQ